MINDWLDFWMSVFASVVIISVVGAELYSFFDEGHAIPVSGVVAEKVLVNDGYGNHDHILKIEIANGEYAWITTSARVWSVVAEGAWYEFGGPRHGQSYNSVKVVEGE